MSVQNKILIQEFVIFIIFSIISLLTAHNIILFASNATVQSVVVEQSEVFQAGKFILSFFFATIFLLVFLKFFKESRIIFEVTFSLGLLSGTWMILLQFLSVYISLIIAILFIFLRLISQTVWAHNLVVVVGLAGIVATLGLQMPSLTIVIILLALSVYDYIAVYKTKHMVWMAKELIRRRVIFAIILPTKLRDYNVKVKNVEPEKGFAIMGTGDLALPMMLAVSALYSGLLNSIFVLIGILVGVWLANYIFHKTKKSIPALPPIGICAILGWLVQFLA